MFKLLMLAIGWLLTVSSYASNSFENDYYDNFYQECDNTNRDFTDKVIHTARGYCTPNGYDWPQCIDPEKQESLAGCDVPNLKAPNIIELSKQYNWYYNTQPIEDNIPPVCFLASTAWGLNQWKDNPRYYQCDENDLNPKDTGKPPCSSKPYIHTIANAFNEVANCFDFEKEDKTMAFGLAHHESRFKINKAEESGPEPKTHRCFGQIDNKFISTLNQYIVHKDPHHTKYKKIYDDAMKQCPYLENIVTPRPDLIKHKSNYIPPEVVKECEQKKCTGLEKDALQECEDECEKTDFIKAHEEHGASMICKTSKDPYSCSVYTMFNIKVTEARLKQYLLDNPQVNSLEVDTDSCRKVGEKSCRQKGREFCKKKGIEDCKEIEKQMCQYIGKRSCKIFDEDHFYFKWGFIPWTHNAGFDGIVKTDFKRFTKYLRGKINNPNVDCEKFCQEGSENQETQECKYCGYKDDILDRKPLRGEILIKEFQEYAGNPKHNVSNYKQVSDIIDNMQDNLAELTYITEENAKDFPKHEGAIKDAIKNLPNEYKSNNKDKRIGTMRADLDDFLIHVSRQCPTEFPNYKKVD